MNASRFNNPWYTWRTLDVDETRWLPHLKWHKLIWRYFQVEKYKKARKKQILQNKLRFRWNSFRLVSILFQKNVLGYFYVGDGRWKKMFVSDKFEILVLRRHQYDKKVTNISTITISFKGTTITVSSTSIWPCKIAVDFMGENFVLKILDFDFRPCCWGFNDKWWLQWCYNGKRWQFWVV